MESYLQKIDFIVTILTSLDSRVNDEDVVHYALEGLPDKYNQMRLKSKALALPMDSSSPMVLVAESSTNSRSSRSKGKSLKPCFNFAKVFCRYGNSCRYAHDANARVSNANKMNVAMSNNGTNVTLPNPATVTPPVTRPNIASTIPTAPHAFYASPGTSLGPNPTPPPGFPPLAQAHLPYYGYTAASNPTHLTPPAARPVHTTLGPVNYVTQPTGSLVMGSASSSGAVNTSGQATLLPQAFTAGTLHDPTTGAWNMDTGASSHLNNSIISLSTILNSCMYSTVLVGDGHSIPVTNTGHSILSTPLKSLRLNNVLITPHIVKNMIFVRNNDCTIEFDSFGFSVKDFMTRRVLLRCDSTGDLYHVTAPSPIPSAFIVSQQTWHQLLGHPGREVKCCDCDHGGEFDNRKLHDLFNTNGIQFRFSCPQTSQQNGKSERMVRTINNLIRTLLFQANLPPTFWVEALNMVVHLINILPSTSIDNEISFTHLFGTQPDYSLLRTFGCLCYPHLYPTHKLEPRATPSIFLGHASSHHFWT
ncbi:ribonuclease H-like domain-containing protein [Tanacetum coccineum]